MIIYFYLFIPLVCRFAESSSTKGGGHKNDLVPFLSSRLDLQKDNSLKIVSNEPFIIQFQMPPQSSENVQKRAKVKDKNTKRSDKKRISKIKPLRKKIRKRRDVSEAESRQVKPDQSKKPRPEEKGQSNQIKTQNSAHRLEILKALNTHAKKKETKNLSPEDVDKAEATTSRNLHTNHQPSLPARDSHVRMMYPNTPKSETHNYSYKDLIADRERLEQKINYIRNLFHVNDTTADDGARVRRKSDSDKTANKIAKMFLTLSAVNGLHDKRSKCRENNDNDRGQDIWKKDRRKITSRQSSSSNEERYKVKKWIEYMKSKRSSSKTCPCMANEYNEENDIFPLEQKLAKDYQLTETGASSEEFSDSNRDTLGHSRGRLSKSGYNRNSYRDDARSKLRALANRGGRKYELPVDDLELYRSRAKQILQNAEEILDKIKEEEERRLAAPQAIVSHLRELTSKIQGDPRNNENDLIKIIQKNLGWIPQPKSQTQPQNSETDGNSFLENMKAFILDPYEKAKALTDESTKKLSSYLLRNLGKIDSSEEQEAGKGDQDPQIYHGQVPQNEEMFSANLAKENLESDSLAKEREEHQNWSDTLSAMLGGSDERSENTQDDALKQTKNQEDSFKGRMEEMIQEQEKKINAFTEKPEKNENVGEEGTKITVLMTGEQNETPEVGEQPENAETFKLEKQDENVEKSDASQDGVIGKESETVKSTAEQTESDVIASEQTTEDQITPEEFAESIQENVDKEDETVKVRANLPSEVEDVKGAIDQNSSKEVDTTAEYVDDKKDLESAKSNENQEKDVKDVVMEPAAEFEKDTKEKEQSSENSQEQDDKVQSKQDREENDVLNSKHLVLEDLGRSEDEELEELTEDIKNLLEETTKQKLEEHDRTVTKKEYNSAETKDPKEDERENSSSPDSAGLEKQAKVVAEGIQDEPRSEHKTSEVVKASQDSKESLQYDGSKEDKASSGRKNSVEDLEETEMVESSEKSSYESEKSENSAEGVVEKAENPVESEKETIDYVDLDKTESVDEETKREDDTLKSELTDEVKEDDEEVREESGNQEKEILRENLNGAEQDKSDQEEPSLKASLDESDDKHKSDEIPLQKSLKENEENLDASTDESPENETLEKSSEQMTVKASKQSREENEEVDETQDEEASLKASKPENADEIQDTSNEGLVEETETEFDNRENEPQVKAQLTEDEIDGESEELSLRSEHPEGDPQKSNESLMNTSGSKEKVEAVENETLKEESSERENEESIGETLKSKSDEVHKDTEEMASTEYEKVKAQERENENLKENSGEGSIEMSNTPKLLMSIKEEDKETMKSNQEGSKENDEPVGETLNASDDLDAESLNKEDQLRGTNQRADEKGEMQEVLDDEDDINVRAENIKDLDNQIDDESFQNGELRSTIAEELDEDATLKEVNSLERENFNADDAIGETDQIKEVTVGKKKKDPVSEEVQNSRPNQSRSTLKVPKSIGKIMRDLSGKEKDDFTSLTNLNPENIDHIIDKIDEAEHRDKLESEDVDCRKECACADDIYTRSRNIGRYEIVKDFLHWAKDLQLNRVLSDD